MKYTKMLGLGLCLCLVFTLGMIAHAADKPTAKKAETRTKLTQKQVTALRAKHKGLALGTGKMTAADKAELKKQLKGVDPNLYFIRFADGTTLGKKRMRLGQVTASSRIRKKGDQQGMTFIVESPDYVYIYTTDLQGFQSKVGQQKARKIQTLLSKYRLPTKSISPQRGKQQLERKLTQKQVTALRAKHKGLALGTGKMTAADKAELKKQLKGVDPSLYFIRFADGTTLGKKRMRLGQVTASSRIRKKGDQQGMTFITKSPDYVYIYTTDLQGFQSKIGQQKAQQIQTLLGKYR